MYWKKYLHAKYLSLRVRVLTQLSMGTVGAVSALQDVAAQLVPAVGEVAVVPVRAARHVVLPVPAHAHPVVGRQLVRRGRRRIRGYGGAIYRGGGAAGFLLLLRRVFVPTVGPVAAPGAKPAHCLAQVILPVGESAVVQIGALSTLQ